MSTASNTSLSRSLASDRAERPITKIISVSTADLGSGAERMAWGLFKGYERRAIESWLLVGDKKSDDPHALPFFLSPFIDYSPYRNRWSRMRQSFLKNSCQWLGMEDFEFPYTRLLPSITGSSPDIVHCHNLHGGYFDLRALVEISRRLPVFLTLHDCWIFTGHCSRPVTCNRWESGCGACPDLKTEPAIARDATAFNWHRKAKILEQCRLFVSAPSSWLMERARRSLLGPAMVESRVIPNGIDLELFRPVDKLEARSELPLPADGNLLVFAARAPMSNPGKDYGTIRLALEKIAGDRRQQPLHLAVIGTEGRSERLGNVTIHHLPPVEQRVLARYFQAADLYVHAAREEPFGLVLAESMACGTPVVATAVGGIPEVVVNGEHGLLTAPGDPAGLAKAIEELIDDPPRRRAMGLLAARHASANFSLEATVDAYLNWFTEIKAQFGSP